MEKVTLLSSDMLFNSFIEEKYIPKGKDKYYLRNTQVKAPKNGWRHLRSDEIETLVKNDNTAICWDNILVTDQFDSLMVKNNKFFGFVRIGRITAAGLQYHDLRLPCGITNSSIHSCDIGDDVSIHNVHYLSHYIIGDRCMLFNVQEMSCTDHAKFGNGIIKEGEEESIRVNIELMNEAGCRKIMPFDGMITADAYMWAKFIDDKILMERLATITQNSFDNRRGYYGTVGSGSIIKNSWIIKDAKIGGNCYIKGASKLKNVTINSSDMEPTQIGENVVLVNGIVGYGCKIFYSCIAVKFVLCSHSNLKYGARLINSFMGDNSTISCCEVLNNLIFPAHEQHHNNSFLIASVIKGQSNLAAGATIGSNHNSRTNDNEIEAGRGFWPGLCTSIKHSSKFACYTFMAKADYPSEMIIPMPFSLVSNDILNDELHVIPAFWWIYNMFALERNNWKYADRDNRIFKVQNIEFDVYAPDTMEEAIEARKLLEVWTAKADLRKKASLSEDISYSELRNIGRKLLTSDKISDKERVQELEIIGENMEKSKRKVRIMKAHEAYHAYGDMIIYYAIKNVLEYLESNTEETFQSMALELDSQRQREWIHMGGQLMMLDDFDLLRADIRNGYLDSWKEIHKRYNELWKKYPMDKLRHAYLSLKFVVGKSKISNNVWMELLNKCIEIQNYIQDQVYCSRQKDYDNLFRKATYRNHDEMISAVGELESNNLILLVRKETKQFIERIQAIKTRFSE